MRSFFALNFRTGLLIGCAAAIAIAAAAITYERYDTKTLKRTKNRDAVLCGVNTGLPGFSSADEKGNWSGFDVDFCRAIAAAIFNDPSKVKFVPLDASERFTELQKRKVDVLSRNTTWNLSRETNYSLHFVAVTYYDGQGFMVHKARKIDSSLELLPDVISKEPLAPVVRHKDDDWLLIVKWTFYAMVNAEELGITSKNLDEALKSSKPDVMRFVGNEGAYGEELGLAKDWAVRIIRHVGNYGEVYDRNVGVDSNLGIPRGLNQLWNAGGILYAPPIR